MNWLGGNKEWGTVICPPLLNCEVFSEIEGETIKELYRFTNMSEQKMHIQKEDISIYATFNNQTKHVDECMTKRCHAHIWCGEEVSYIMGIRMGGEAPHLGLVLTRGSLAAHSVMKDKKKSGAIEKDILLHPMPFSLEPGESYELEWVLFWHDGENDFFSKIKKIGRFIDIKSDKFVFELPERVEIKLYPSFEFEEGSVQILRNDKEVPITIEENAIIIKEQIEEPGAYEYKIKVGGVCTVCRFFVQLSLEELVRKRCHFVVENQQYHGNDSGLDGAYLVHKELLKEGNYDVSMYKKYDCGEGLGIGTLIAAYLQKNEDKDILKSLKQFENFVYRELYNEETGKVFCNNHKADSPAYLDIYPQIVLFFIGLFDLYREKRYVMDAYKAAKFYCIHGGLNYFSVEMPVGDLIYCMRILGMEKEIRDIKQYFFPHNKSMREEGFQHTVVHKNYNQGTVALAVNQFFGSYILRKDKGYLGLAEKYLQLLSLFQGRQPDYRLYKNTAFQWENPTEKINNDCEGNLSSYWSLLTGSAYVDYAIAIANQDIKKNREACVSGALCLFHPDGNPCCANHFSVTLNKPKCSMRGYRCKNDHDWALYYAWQCRYRYQYNDSATK